MLNFCSLYSGSSGNSLFVETENTKILIDAGMSCKKIEEGLQSIEVDPSSINAILVTHEHADHVKGLGTLSKKFDIPVFSTQKTFDAMPVQTEKISEKNIKYFNPSEKFCINDLEILPFNIPHDAANPCGFNIIKDNYICKPGMVAIDAIADYCDELEMKHIYYTIPIFWEKLQGIEYENIIINWLYMVPISDKELEYIEEFGDEKFEELLEEKNVDVFDIYRKSII